MDAEPQGPATAGTFTVPPARTAAKRTGRPVWRTGKPDAVLAAAVETAREAAHSIAKPSDVGVHLAARTEGDRVVTHLFECRLPGYPGWQWFVVLTRNSRSKVVTVNEVGLLPSEDAVLAPEWVPWAQRVRPEDAQPDEAAGDRAADEVSVTPSTEAGMTEANMSADKEFPEAVEPETAEPDTAEHPEDAAAAANRDVIESIRHADLGADRIEDTGDRPA